MSDCFRCNGTGKICDICGEAEGGCMRCTTFSECPDCGGTGSGGDEDKDGNEITDNDDEEA